LGQRPLGAILHSSNEPGELSQWLCHDDSTMNIVVIIIIIIIVIITATKFIIVTGSYCWYQLNVPHLFVFYSLFVSA